MNEIMNWNICLDEHIKKVSIDKGKIDSIKKMCNVRLRILKDVKLDSETASNSRY